MKVEIKGNVLHIAIEMQTPSRSASGKTLVCATTRGNIKTGATVQGKEVIVGLNAYIKAE